MKDLLIKNGIITTHDKQYVGDILISDGKIKEIGKKLIISGNNFETIDATGLLILPGGVDPHVHMSLRSGKAISSDDFETGSIAALSGGTTTFMDFVTPQKGEPLKEALLKRMEETEKSLCDYSLHMSITSMESYTEKEINDMVQNEGIISFKLYMAYKNSIGMNDNDILKAMAMIKNAGGISMIHCENGDIEEFIKGQLISSKRTDISNYPASRPAEMEIDAVNRAILFSKITKCPLYIVHLSTEEGVESVLKAKKDGVSVYAETCPHYLILNDSVYKKGKQSAKFIMSPPLRQTFDINKLWDGISNGILEVISSDHCPFNLKNDDYSGPNDFTIVPKGIGGVDHRMSLMYTKGVSEKKINIHRFVNLTSTRPAKIFGLYPAKGTIMKGSDADIVLWDTNKESFISAKNQFQNCDSSAYEGIKTIGCPLKVIAGGRLVFDNGLFNLTQAKGNYLFRKR